MLAVPSAASVAVLMGVRWSGQGAVSGDEGDGARAGTPRRSPRWRGASPGRRRSAPSWPMAGASARRWDRFRRSNRRRRKGRQRGGGEGAS